MKPRSLAASRKAERAFCGLGDMTDSSNTTVRHAMGLMSGTSLDGIDVAALATDGERRVEAGPALTLPYPDDFRERLRGVLGGAGPASETAAVEAELTRLHAEA